MSVPCRMRHSTNTSAPFNLGAVVVAGAGGVSAQVAVATIANPQTGLSERSVDELGRASPVTASVAVYRSSQPKASGQSAGGRISPLHRVPHNQHRAPHNQPTPARPASSTGSASPDATRTRSTCCQLVRLLPLSVTGSPRSRTSLRIGDKKTVGESLRL